MLKRKNKKALPEQLEDSLYPDDYWLDKEDGQEVSEPLPDGENPVSGKLRKEPMVTVMKHWKDKEVSADPKGR